VDLGKAVASVLSQTRTPDELIIVDQSPDNESRSTVQSLWPGSTGIKLVYIHDTTISGLVEAKQVAAARASGEIVCFLEDDVILEADYLEEIDRGFINAPGMMGCCGVVTNPPRQPPGYAVIYHMFHRGIFRDPRVGLFGSFQGKGHEMILSDVLSGGLSAWRRQVFSVVPFDVANGFFMLEDIDFSTRVVRRFGRCLYINPNARLAHYFSPVNREVLGPRQRRKVSEYILFYRKRRDWPGATLALPWLLVGLLAEATFQSWSVRSPGPLLGCCRGIADGFARPLKGYGEMVECASG
jgi:glycosyltransferase involved in cell wall biosynthesis